MQCEHNTLVTLQNRDLLTKTEILKLNRLLDEIHLILTIRVHPICEQSSATLLAGLGDFLSVLGCPGLLMVKVGQGEQQCYCVNL